MTRRLYPTCPSHSLEHVATRLNVVNGAAHRVLVDACLVKEIFLTMLKDIPTVKTIAKLMRVSQPLTFADAPFCAIEPSPGFEVLATAIAERYTITMIDEWGTPLSRPRRKHLRYG